MTEILNRSMIKTSQRLPVKVMQFGEGNFLRAFVDYAFYRLNKELDFNAGIAIVQPLPGGTVDKIAQQDGLFTLFLNGVKNGEKIQDIHLIDNVVKCINPYQNFDEYLALAQSETLEFVISNTTEAGIEFAGSDTLLNFPQKSFPAKLAVFLYERYRFFNGDLNKGLTIIPCELINHNADTLKNILLQYATLWQLGTGFETWLQNGCSFHNTLVDRIVPGYPKENIQEYQNQLTYRDDIIVTAEPFFLWVIEGDEKLKAKLPFHKTDLDVKIVADMQPYRTRKVRILNGAHTAMVPLSIMYGNETVRETLENDFTGMFVSKLIFDEINPTLHMDKDELFQFSNEVLDRFRNPFIKHLLSDIALNSISKFKVRVLPSMLEYLKTNQKLPVYLTFSMACLIRFYKGDWQGKMLPIKDTPDIVNFFVETWKSENLSQIVTTLLGNIDFWESDLNQVVGLKDALVLALQEIETNGLAAGFANFNKQFA
jgi:tagaturonate reductase